MPNLCVLYSASSKNRSPACFLWTAPDCRICDGPEPHRSCIRCEHTHWLEWNPIGSTAGLGLGLVERMLIDSSTLEPPDRLTNVRLETSDLQSSHVTRLAQKLRHFVVFIYDQVVQSRSPVYCKPEKAGERNCSPSSTCCSCDPTPVETSACPTSASSVLTLEARASF